MLSKNHWVKVVAHIVRYLSIEWFRAVSVAVLGPKNRNRFDDYAVSADAGVEAFIRGFMGFQENANQLQGEMQRLRSRLTARYECEFLPLPNRMET